MKNLKKSLAYIFIISIAFSMCKKVNDSNTTTLKSGTLTDVDGNEYRTVKIGEQWWMAENFKAIHNSDSTEINGIYVYNNIEANANVYGKLYTWNAAKNAEPVGWHLPTDVEWETLIDYLGGRNVAGGKMKAAGTTYWNSPNTGATNESGFTALPGGFHGSDGIFYAIGEHGSFWGTTDDGINPLGLYTFHNSIIVNSSSDESDKNTSIAFAVRYIKD